MLVTYRRFDRTTLVMRTLFSVTPSSVLTIATVFFLFLPLRRTVSPLNRPNSSIFAAFNEIVEWSSVVESSTIRVFGVCFLVRIAVAISAFERYDAVSYENGVRTKHHAIYIELEDNILSCKSL